ncbi:MAG: VCBS repeat-containing protein [Phycisphaerae bacterium]|nr:VCBS repeat-containing protein [Phycisphaerae bacterium]
MTRRLRIAVLCLGALSVTAWAIAPMGTASFTNVLLTKKRMLTDNGPRPPVIITWYQLDRQGVMQDSLPIFRTDDDANDAAVADLDGNGRPELILAGESRINHRSAVRVATLDRMGILSPGGFQNATAETDAFKYSGLTTGDFNGDGRTDLLAVESYPNDTGRLVWMSFEKTAKGFRATREVPLPAGNLSTVTAVALTDLKQDRRPDVLIAVPGATGTQIVRLTFAVQGNSPRLLERKTITTMASKMGTVHGLTFIPGGESPELFVAVRKPIRKGETFSEEMETPEGDFFAPLPTTVDTENDRSTFWRILFDADANPSDPKPMSDFHIGNNWVCSAEAIAPLPPVVKPKALPRKNRPQPPYRILALRGLFSAYYQIDALGRMKHCELTKRGTTFAVSMRQLQADDFNSVEQLNPYDAVLLVDLPISAMSYRQLLLLDAYVRGGGKLVVFDGPTSGRAGGYLHSPLEKILPAKVGPRFSIRKFDTPYSLGKSASGKPAGWVYYYKTVGPLQSRARVLLRHGETPLLLERTVGRGRVWLFTGLPIGQDEPDTPGFWRTAGWPEELYQWLFGTRCNTRALLPKPLTYYFPERASVVQRVLYGLLSYREVDP